MGSVFAALAAEIFGGFENLILVSPTHAPFEGTLRDKNDHNRSQRGHLARGRAALCPGGLFPVEGRKENLDYFARSDREIIRWVMETKV